MTPKLLRISLALVVALALLPVHAWQALRAASETQPARNDASPSQLVTQFLARTDEYTSVFRNLLAEETKLVEVYRPSGELARQRRIVSDLVVYRSSRDDGATAEYRNARVVDGKPVAKSDARALKLLVAAAGADSLQKELELINREGLRYDFNFSYHGFTISQTAVLRQSRELFRFESIGEEQIEGHDVVVLGYQQTAPISGSFNILLPSEFAGAPRLTRGRLWLDRSTRRLWREEWEVTVRHPAAADPLVLLRQEKTYTPSDYGILTPHRFVFSSFLHVRHRKREPPALLLSGRTTFTYGAFKRFEVSTDERIK